LRWQTNPNFLGIFDQSRESSSCSRCTHAPSRSKNQRMPCAEGKQGPRVGAVQWPASHRVLSLTPFSTVSQSRLARQLSFLRRSWRAWVGQGRLFPGRSSLGGRPIGPEAVPEGTSLSRLHARHRCYSMLRDATWCYAVPMRMPLFDGLDDPSEWSRPKRRAFFRLQNSECELLFPMEGSVSVNINTASAPPLVIISTFLRSR